MDFDVEITLAEPPRDIRPDLSCTARIVTDTRKQVLAIPIIALTVREHEAVPNEADRRPRRHPAQAGHRGAEEAEGARGRVRGARTASPRSARSRSGIAGDEYFEVLDGLATARPSWPGTYQAIRDLKDGAKVQASPRPPRTTKKEGRRS